jgi:hypothetical protein
VPLANPPTPSDPESSELQPVTASAIAQLSTLVQTIE